MLDLFLEQCGTTLPSFLAQASVDAASSAELTVGTAQPIWSQLIVILLGAVSYLAMQAGIVKSKGLFTGGILLALVTVGLAAGLMPVSIEGYIAFAFYALAGGGAMGFLTAREPVYAALGFATTVLSTCGVLFMQSALFIAAATMIVYAGATIIIFLFVLMFAQQSTLRSYDIKLTDPSMATAIGTIVLIAITVCVTQPGVIPTAKVDETRLLSEATTILKQTDIFDVTPVNTEDGEPTTAVVTETSEGDAEEATSTEPVSAAPATTEVSEPVRIPETTAELGRSLYTDYLAAVDLAGVLLLVATLGAIALATRTTAEVNG